MIVVMIHLCKYMRAYQWPESACPLIHSMASAIAAIVISTYWGMSDHILEKCSRSKHLNVACHWVYACKPSVFIAMAGSCMSNCPFSLHHCSCHVRKRRTQSVSSTSSRNLIACALDLHHSTCNESHSSLFFSISTMLPVTFVVFHIQDSSVIPSTLLVLPQ